MPDAPSHIDLNAVTWLHADIRDWRVTSRLTDVRFEPGRIVLQHSKAGQWPVKRVGETDIEGNPWVFAWRNNRWHGATYEWLRPGQTSKNITADNIGAHIKKAPLDTWRPQAGELVGFCVSTLARDNTRTSNERSDVVLVRWGSSQVVWREAGTPAPVPGPTPAPTPGPSPSPGHGYRDEDYAAFSEWLNEKYLHDLHRDPLASWHVDPVGIGRWFHDFITGRMLYGFTAGQALDAVNRRINEIVGLPVGQGPANPFHGPPTSGPDTPRPSPNRATVEPVKTDFLSAMDGMFPHLTPGLDANGRAKVYAALTARGYTHICLYPANEGDYARQGVRVSFDHYQDPGRLMTVLEECWDVGLAPVLWLMPDDSPSLHTRYRPGSGINVGPMVRLWSPLVSHFVAGLEIDEYWNADLTVRWVQDIAGVTDKPIGLHFTPGKAPMDLIRRASAVSSLWYQYTTEEARSDGAVVARSRNLVSDLRRVRPSLKLVASEFGGGIIGTAHEATSRARGRAAMTVDGVIGSSHGA